MSAEQAAADDTSRAPDCVVELSMDRQFCKSTVSWIERGASDHVRSHPSPPVSRHFLHKLMAGREDSSTVPELHRLYSSRSNSKWQLLMCVL